MAPMGPIPHGPQKKYSISYEKHAIKHAISYDPSDPSDPSDDPSE